MDTLRTIRLYGKLGTTFGRVHRLAVASAAEAVRALSALLPGFERELMTSHQRGIRYAVFLGKTNIGRDELELSGGDADIRIAPVLAGAKNGGVLQTIAGVGLYLAGAALTTIGFATGNPLLFSAGVGLKSLAAYVMIGGVIQALSPQQSGTAAQDSPDKAASYNFQGPVNTTVQGNPVPVLYGRMIVGSAVISAGIVAEDQAYVGAPLTQPPIPHVLGLFEDQ